LRRDFGDDVGRGCNERHTSNVKREVVTHHVFTFHGFDRPGQIGLQIFIGIGAGPPAVELFRTISRKDAKGAKEK